MDRFLDVLERQENRVDNRKCDCLFLNFLAEQLNSIVKQYLVNWWQRCYTDLVNRKAKLRHKQKTRREWCPDGLFVFTAKTWCLASRELG